MLKRHSPPDGTRPKRRGSGLLVGVLATFGLAVASVIWSESWFWARWREGQEVSDLVGAVVVYAAAVQVCMFAAHRFRVPSDGPRAWRRVFLLGALYGWLVEGVVVTTVVESLPLSISYTGLAWHALFTVLLGWWWVPRVLEKKKRVAVGWLALLGVGVGTWAVHQQFEKLRARTRRRLRRICHRHHLCLRDRHGVVVEIANSPRADVAGHRLGLARPRRIRRAARHRSPHHDSRTAACRVRLVDAAANHPTRDRRGGCRRVDRDVDRDNRAGADSTAVAARRRPGRPRPSVMPRSPWRFRPAMCSISSVCPSVSSSSDYRCVGHAWCRT